MIRRPPRSTRTDTLFPYTTLFRSFGIRGALRLEAGDDLVITPSLFFQRINGDNPIATQSNLPGFGRASAIGDEPSRTDLFVANLPVEKTLGHRSEERRVGTECESTGRYRWCPDQEQKK